MAQVAQGAVYVAGWFTCNTISRHGHRGLLQRQLEEDGEMKKSPGDSFLRSQVPLPAEPPRVVSLHLKLCVALLLEADAEHRLVEDPTLVEGSGHVREGPPGHLHRFKAAVFVSG